MNSRGTILSPVLLPILNTSPILLSLLSHSHLVACGDQRTTQVKIMSHQSAPSGAWISEWQYKCHMVGETEKSVSVWKSTVQNQLHLQMAIFCVKYFLAEPIKIIIRAPKILCIVNYACLLIYRSISDTRLTRTSGRLETGRPSKWPRLLSPREIVVRTEIISYGTYGVYNNGSTVDCFFRSPILNIHEGSWRPSPVEDAVKENHKF